MNVYRDIDDDHERAVYLRAHGLQAIESPRDVYIELTRGCNRRCHFCGVPKELLGIKKTEMQFMTIEQAKLLCKNMPDSINRIEWAMDGEPLWNKNAPAIFGLFRKRWPKIQQTVITNLDPIRLEYGIEFLEKCFSEGLNFAHIDLYDKSAMDWFNTTILVNKDRYIQKGIEILSYYDSGINAYSYQTSTRKVLLYVTEVSGFNQSDYSTRKWHGWLGNIPFEKWKTYNKEKEFFTLPWKRTCSNPNKHLAIHLNGIVNGCCQDGPESHRLGNVYETPLIDIWTGENMRALRTITSAGRRDLSPACRLCNYRSFRDGLWPMWQKPMNKEEAEKIIEACTVLTEDQKRNTRLLKEGNQSYAKD